MKTEKFALFKSLIAFLAILGCLWAMQWQFARGVDRQQENAVIAQRLELKPRPLAEIQGDVSAYEWSTVTTKGYFQPNNQILLRNRYFEGQYGFEVLTRFESEDGRKFWVDRGWVKAGKNASTPPTTTTVPKESVEITARLRLDSSLPQGAFFAMPSSKNGGLVRKLNAQSGLSSENFYLDLIFASDADINPAAPAQLPELSDGPHMAYAVQWLFFAGLILYGRVLIRRSEILPVKEL